MNLGDIANSLQPKDQANFKQLIKFYDAKQHKKGFKLAEKILETNPGHAETTSLKGLFLSLTDSKEEGLKLCKSGLMKNLKGKIFNKGSLCWHILGIVHRNDKNYIEATKCYTQAYKLDGQNQQISRDLTLMSIQVKDYAQHHTLRLEALQANAKNPMNWVSFAVANELVGEYEEGIKVMDSFKKILDDLEDIKPHEKSEIFLYEARLYGKLKNYKKQKQVLKKNEKEILDKTAYYEIMLDIETQNNDRNQQILILEQFIKFRKLLDLNAENHIYIEKLFKIKEESPKAFFEKMIAQYPQSTAFKFIKLKHLQGDDFTASFTDYIKKYYTQGKPSLFNEIKGLYSDIQKKNKIETIFLNINNNLEKNLTFPSETEPVHPGAQLWSYMVLAQHYDFLKNYNEALSFINKAIEHTPTLIELYLIKGKIYKHMQNFSSAYEAISYASNLDQVDRYLNNKSIKYALLLNDTKEADRLIRLYMKHEEDMNIYELQTTWFEHAMAKAFIRKQNYAAGLRQYKFVLKQFDDILDDQFDFHMYCFRKYTLRQYVELIEFCNTLVNQKTFLTAFTEYIEALLEYEKVKDGFKVEIQEPADELDKKIREKLDLDGAQLLKDLNPIKEAVLIANKFEKCEIKDENQAKLTYKAVAKAYLADKKFEQAANYILKLSNLDAQASKSLIADLKKKIDLSFKEDKLSEKAKEKIRSIQNQFN